MADETTQNQSATSGKTAKTTTGDEAQTVPDPAKPGEKTGGGEQPKIFTQADMDRVAANVREDVKKQNARDAERQKETDRQEQLRKNGEFETLANQKQKRIDELETEIVSERIRSIRAEVAAETKLPKQIADLLQGSTREELTTHAKELAKLVLPPKAADFESGIKPPVDAVKAAEAEQQRLFASGRYSGL